MAAVGLGSVEAQLCPPGEADPLQNQGPRTRSAGWNTDSLPTKAAGELMRVFMPRPTQPSRMQSAYTPICEYRCGSSHPKVGSCWAWPDGGRLRGPCVTRCVTSFARKWLLGWRLSYAKSYIGRSVSEPWECVPVRHPSRKRTTSHARFLGTVTMHTVSCRRTTYAVALCPSMAHGTLWSGGA